MTLSYANFQQILLPSRQKPGSEIKEHTKSNRQLAPEVSALQQRIAELETQNTELILKNQGLTQECAEKKRIEADLRECVAELGEQNRALEAFAHTVAHDLKNPISLVIGMAELLKADYATNQLEYIPEYIEGISRSSRKANDIIESLLLLAKWQYKKEVQTTPLNMFHIVYDVLDRLTPMIKEAHAEITLSVDWPTVQGYAPWVEEVWINYLSNAIKYGGQPAKIALGATLQEDGLVRFWVKDEGPGLTPPEQAKLFKPFTRLTHKQIEGTGLGLSIVKSIVEKLGGQVGVESKGPGQGSTFYFTLPASQPPNL